MVRGVDALISSMSKRGGAADGAGGGEGGGAGIMGSCTQLHRLRLYTPCPSINIYPAEYGIGMGAYACLLGTVMVVGSGSWQKFGEKEGAGP